MEAAKKIEPLPTDAKLKDVVAKLNELIEHVNTSKPAGRDRGPVSLRVMTDDDARRLLLGDLKDTDHKKAAEVLELSYGQVYSARKGFTFKTIYREWRNLTNHK